MAPYLSAARGLYALAMPPVRTIVQELSWCLDVCEITPPRRGARVRLGAIWAALFLKERGKFSKHFCARVTWDGPAGPVSAVVSDLSELKVIREVFFGAEYALPHVTDPRVILDLGSHAGYSVLYFKARFPEARVVAVEPHPETFERLRRNVGGLSGVELVNAAIGDADGTMQLYSGADSWASAATPSPTRPTAHTVPTTSIHGLVERLALDHIDVLKMDIEGGEVAVLREGRAVLDRTQTMVFEFHQEHTEETLWSLLRGLEEFEVVELKGHSAGHPLVTLSRSN
jgi:FkbM family methyltransferase